MAERAADLQSVQIGVEAVPGTPVPADTILQTLADFSPGVQKDVDQDRVPTGTKFPAFVIPGREWVEGGFSGQLSYTEILYFLAGIIGPAGVAPGAAGPDGERLWGFRPSRAAQDFPATFTIEQGNPERAHRLAYSFLSELSLRFDPSAAEMSGTIMARALADNIGAMTAAPTSPDLRPVHPSHVNVYLDDTAAGIGTTKLTRDFAVDLGIGDKYSALFTVDSAQANSFAALVETRPSITLGLTMEADSQGMENLPRLRNGDTAFVRIEALGATIGAAARERLTIDGAFKVTDMGDFGSEQDVVTNDWGFRNVWDNDLGFALDFEVVNEMAAL